MKLLKRQLAPRSRNPLKDSLGAIEDVVAMTDRVIEIQLGRAAAQPSVPARAAGTAVLRDGQGTGPFKATPAGEPGGELAPDRARSSRATTKRPSMRRSCFQARAHPKPSALLRRARADLVLGGTFVDLPLLQHLKLARGALRFDPVSGLFGLVPARRGGPLDNPDVRHLLAQALDRGNFVNALAVPALTAPRDLA